MRRSLIRKRWQQLVTATGLVVAFMLGAVVLAQPPDRVAIDQANDPGAVEYLTRGPLHEAFAEPYEANPAVAPLVSAEPPEPIDELPPEYRPDGDNVQWIPGYWAWDDEREDFLWISGLWREVPPDQRWVPGYWVDARSGYQWISGFWAGTQLVEIEYLPEPPESLEAGPSAPAPAENHFYIPGHWVYQDSAYRWRPGFWSPVHENWVWVPAQYIWTPRGTLFRQGYWDYDIAYRGVVFTPVYYRQPVYRSQQFVYRPRYTIDTGVNLLVHMFVRPSARHYYFGDYYGPQYADSFEPWVVRYQRPTYYDPFYAQYRSRSIGQTANVLTWVTTQHQVFATSEQFRPARTIAAQRQLIQTAANTNIDPTILRLSAVGESIENVAEEPDSNFRFQALNENEVERVRESTRPMRELVRMRRTVESEPVAADATDVAQAETDEADADPQQRRRSREGRGTRGRLQLPEVVQSTTTDAPESGDAATDAVTERENRAEDTPRRGRDASEDLPPGRQAMELTPEEQRDRRFNASAAVPEITDTQPGSLGLGAGAAATPGATVQPGVTRTEIAPDAVGAAVGTAEPQVPAGEPGTRPGRTRPGALGRQAADADTSAGEAALPNGDTALRPGDTTITPGDTLLAPGNTALTPGREAMPAEAATRPGSDLRPGDAGQRPSSEQQPAAAQRSDDASRPGEAGQQPGAAGQGRGNTGQGAGAARGQQRPGGAAQDPAGRRPGAAGQQPGAAGQQPDAIGQQPGVVTQQPGVISQQPGVVTQQPGVIGQQPGAAVQRGDAAAGAAAAPGAADGQTAPQALPGTEETRDPAAGQRMRGDVRLIPDDRAGSAQRGSSARVREERMRPARPDGWPPRGERTRSLPTRPGADIGLERSALEPGGPPAIGGAAPGLNEAAVPRAGNLSPGGAPGVGRGAPNQTGTTRSREAQPHTLPDLTEEEGRRQRR